MSELRDLLRTVDEQGEEIDRLANVVSTLDDKNIYLDREIAAIRKEIVEFQSSVTQIVKDMGFDVRLLARNRSCRT